MREVFVKDVDVGSIRAAHGFRERMQDPGVVRMAQSIRTVGLVAPPCVRASDMKLVSGEDKVAACHILGMKQVRCRMIECSDQALSLARDVETAYRGADVAEQYAAVNALLDQVEREVKAEPEPASRGPGGRPSPRGEARRRVGAVIGKSEAALAKHDSRQRSHTAPRPKVAKPEGWKLDGYGFDVPPGVQERAERIKQAMETTDNHARTIQRVLAGLADDFSDSVAIHELARRAGAVARALVPTHLCPWCKANEHAIRVCGGCFMRGFVCEKDFEAADERLRTERLISYQGVYVNMDTMRAISEGDPLPGATFISEDSFECEEEPPAMMMDESDPMYGAENNEEEF